MKQSDKKSMLMERSLSELIETERERERERHGRVFEWVGAWKSERERV